MVVVAVFFETIPRERARIEIKKQDFIEHSLNKSRQKQLCFART